MAENTSGDPIYITLGRTPRCMQTISVLTNLITEELTQITSALVQIPQPL